jgi:glycogen debranching enzyme
MNPNSGVILTNHFKFPNDIKVGDYVRILKEQKQFQKGYADNFSRQIYHVIQGNGYTFSLQDENKHRLDRKYKYHELRKVTKVEKYLNRQTDREKPLTIGLSGSGVAKCVLRPQAPWPDSEESDSESNESKA